LDDKRVTLAAVAGAHGIGGEVRLKLFAESVDSLAAHRDVEVGGRGMTLLSAKSGGATAIVRLAEITDRNAAEALRGALVTVARSSLPQLGEGEYYHADILGLPCIDTDDNPLGHIAAIENFGAGDLIEVERPDGKRSLVPFRAGIADFDGTGRIVIDPVFLA